MSVDPATWRATWRRLGPLGPLAIVAGAVLLAYPAYLWQASLAPLLAGSEGHANDFRFYHEAVSRLASDPSELYSDRDFLYPPPAVLLFAALSWCSLAQGWVALGLLTVACIVASVLLFARLWEQAVGERVDRATTAALLIVALASAPAMQTIKLGQASALVLPAALSMLVWLPRRPAAAALALAAGFWLKVYPIGLAVLAVRGAGKARFWVALAAGLAGIPLLLLWVLPAALYADWLDSMVWTGGHAHTGAMNQGLPAVVERFRHGPEAFATYIALPLGPWARAAVAGATIVLGAAMLSPYLLRRTSPEATGVALLACVPVLSSFGWEHAYVLALPLLWWALLRLRGASMAGRAGVLVAGLVLLVPKPPERVIAWALKVLPRPASDVLHARFLIVVIALIAVHLLHERRSIRPSAHD